MTPLPLQETLVEATGLGTIVLVLSLAVTAIWVYTIYNYEPNSKGKPAELTD